MVGAVAVLLDIHGVGPVLDAVLGEPDVASAELIVVTGDHAAGPTPVAVLNRLVGLQSRTYGEVKLSLILDDLAERFAKGGPPPGLAALNDFLASAS